MVPEIQAFAILCSCVLGTDEPCDVALLARGGCLDIHVVAWRVNILKG